MTTHPRSPQPPLDADTRALLKAMSDAGSADLLSLPLAQARDLAGAPVFSAPELRYGLDVVDTSARRSDHPDVPVRVYRSANCAGAEAPALLYLHGGGWMFGGLDTVDHVCRSLADSTGVVVLSVDYRLTPEHPFPAALEDVATAVHWVAAEADRIGVRVDRVAIAGDSAGANLAIAACLRDRDLGRARVTLMVLAYPVANHDLDTSSYQENAEGLLLTREMMRTFWKAYAPGTLGTSPYASVLRAPLHDLPPTLVLTASHDPLRDEGEQLARGLASAGVPTQCVRFDGTVHGFLVRYPILSAGRAALEMISDVVRLWSRGESWHHDVTRAETNAASAAYRVVVPSARPSSPR